MNKTDERKQLPYGRAEAVVSSSHKNVVLQNTILCLNNQCLDNNSIHKDFVIKYREWVSTTKLNTIIGLENFPVTTYSNGTTESFDKFYLKNKTKRLRVFKGEYMYHQASGRNYFPNWKFIDDEELKENDVVIISHPFSDTGCEHPLYKQTLDTCANLGIPVLVDCAFFGLCSDIVFDFTHPAITDITFSLSKFLPVAHLRIGMRLTKIDDDDTLLIAHKMSYVNRIGAAVGENLIKLYSPDFNYNTYRSTQETFCKKLQVLPSNTVIFGIDTENRYQEYNRGYVSNRLCFPKYLKNRKLPI